ncbi:hypothetical protein QFC19_004594 [Naganishia cerealis]|uniref:Uncharacterized protein n=1 Tax=Naganishia cerealis TaxID=610337 RepID=A0ACC2VW73_9TREE|nr:hypothetical protein QFC19_004594 [Naganishia cerealis]
MSASTSTSAYIPHPLSPEHRIHLITCAPSSPAADPVLLVHGLGSAASFWLPALATPAGRLLTSHRTVYAIDAYGHGVSDFVAAEDSLDAAAETVRGVIEWLLKDKPGGKVVLGGHSMSGVSTVSRVMPVCGDANLAIPETQQLVTSLVAARHPDLISKLFLLSPTLSLPAANRASLTQRAETVLTPTGRLDISGTVSTTGISPASHSRQPLASAFIRQLVITTDPRAYAQACKNLAAHPGWDADVRGITAEVVIVAGEEDYMVPSVEVRRHAEQVQGQRGRAVVMPDVGHWGALEVPERVAEELCMFVLGKEARPAL